MGRFTNRAACSAALLVLTFASPRISTARPAPKPIESELAHLRAEDRRIGLEGLRHVDPNAPKGPIREVAPNVRVTETIGPPSTRPLESEDEIHSFLKRSKPPILPGSVENLFVNGDFETADFTGWTTESFLGIDPFTPGCGASTTPVHAFITNPGTLALTNSDPLLDQVFQNAHSARLGDQVPWGTSGPKCSRISQSLVVPATNTNFTFAYAVMAANPGGGHSPADSPYFDILVEEVSPTPTTIYHVNDNTSTAAGNCAPWCTGAIDPYSNNSVAYRRWSTVSLNLSAYQGATIKFTLLASDCTPTAHFCSVFLDNIAITCPDSTPPNTVGLAGACFNGPNGQCAHLTWLAPYDVSYVADASGNCQPVIGPVSSYDIRYAATPITTPSAFAAATQVLGEPVPAAYNTAQSMDVCPIPLGTTYFALVSSDASGNTSAIASTAVTCGADTACPTVDTCCVSAPHFSDPVFVSKFPGPVAVVTRESEGVGGYVLSVFDLVHNIPSENANWNPMNRYHGPGNSWVQATLGTVFGLTLDRYGNIYVAHTSCYGADFLGTVPGGGAGAVYRIDGVTGAISVFAKLPNFLDPTYGYPGLGNLTYDCAHNQFFVTDLEDGRLYRIHSASANNASPAIIDDSFDPILADPDPPGPHLPSFVPSSPGFAPLGERVWGVQWHGGRVFYAVWSNDAASAGSSPGPNAIWSVKLDAAGDFIPSTEHQELTIPVLPGYPFSNPVSDISFSPVGKMLLAERGMASPTSPYPHYARALEYACINGTWSPANTYQIGCFSDQTNCAGGVDYDADTYNGPFSGTGAKGRVWATGDALTLTCSSTVIYGLQGLRPTLAVGNTTTSLLIDLDGVLGTGDKTHYGDVEIPCPQEHPRPQTPAIRSADWFHDAFPFNDVTGPGTSAFDTTSALIKTGFNTAQLTGTNCRLDIPGDSLLACSCDSLIRMDLVFRIKPGVGNYKLVGVPSSGLRVVPTTLVVAIPGSLNFWGQYLAANGDFGTPGGHPGGVWSPQVWNSARCDTAEQNLFPVQSRGNLPGLSKCVWASTYHESDPKYGTLGIPRPICFLVDPAGPINSTNITCGVAPAWANSGAGYNGVPNTIEHTKIIPDGLLTPGAHVEYFLRQSKLGTPSVFTMAPDTNVVTPQPGEGSVDCDGLALGVGSTDGHRWQQFGVLPDRWKDTKFGGRGMASLLFIDLGDGHGDEQAWVTAADFIGATATSRFGAHNGWHVPTLSADPNSPANFVRAHGGQPGTVWDMYGIRGCDDPLNGFAGSIGSRVSCASYLGAASGKQPRIAPTPQMLRVYYCGLYVLSGDLEDRLLGPLLDRSQDDVAILTDYVVNSAGRPQPRFMFVEGEGFAESQSLDHPTFLSSIFGADLVVDSYPNPAGCVSVTPSVTYGTSVRGLENVGKNDVLDVDAGIVEATVGSSYANFGGGGPYVSGIYKPASFNPLRNWITLLDGWDIKRLGSFGCATPNGRLNYLLAALTNMFPGTCQPSNGNPRVTPRHDPVDAIPVDPGIPAVNFMALRNVPLQSGDVEIRLGLTKPDYVKVTVLDLQGRYSRNFPARLFEAGEHSIAWDGRDDRDRLVPPGVYFVRVRYASAGFEAVRRLIVMK